MKKLIFLSVLVGGLFFQTPSEASAASYKVKEGDSLWLISQRYGVSVEELKNANGISESEIISGEYLQIPANSGGTHTVQNGESLWTIANDYGVTVAQLQQLNNLQGSVIYPGQALAVQVQATEASNSAYSEEDLDLLARLVHSEARGEPYEGKVAVAAVVLNRTNHEDFPSSIEGVVYETHQSGQIFAFEPVQNGEINRHADAESIQAAEEALNGYDPTNGATYFFNPDTATSSWIESRTINQRIGNHVFSN